MKRFIFSLIFLFFIFQTDCFAQKQSVAVDTNYIQTLIDSSKTLYENQDAQNAIITGQNALSVIELSLSNADTKTQRKLTSQKATLLRVIGNIYKDAMLDYPKALDNYQRSLKSAKEVGDHVNIGAALLNSGEVYLQLKDYKKALDNLNQSFNQFESIGLSKGIAMSNSSLGAVYNNLHKDSLALQYYQKSLSLYNEIQDTALAARQLNNMAEIFVNQKRFSEAKDNYHRSLKMFEAIGDSSDIGNSLFGIGFIYNEVEKNPQKAEGYFLRALAVAKKFDIGLEREALGALKDLYHQQARYKEAFEMYNQYNLIKDSISSQQNAEEIRRRELVSDFDEKQAKLQSEKEKDAAVAEEKSRRQKVIIWFVAGGLLLVIIFSLFVLNRWRLTQRQKKIIEKQKEEVDTQRELADSRRIIAEEQKQVIETQKTEVEKAKHEVDEKNKDITDSINYAQRIQRAVLPHRRDILQAFPESFVLFRPKDIVSGDFYWAYQAPPRPSPLGREEAREANPEYFTAEPALYQALKERAENFRSNPTQSEGIAWELLKRNATGFHIRRQHIIGQYIVDFVSIKTKTVIEIDGDIHDHQVEEDAMRTRHLESHGFLVVRFRNEQVLSDPDNFMFRIKSILTEREHLKVLPHGEDLGGAPLFHIGCCDCTGHGVPGAFMSLLNISFLNQAVKERGITEPDKILNDVRVSIVRALNPDGTDERKDGMDAVLCSFDIKNKILHAACANNPIWYIQNGELKEIKPDKMPVGSHTNMEISFTKHSIQLQEGDSIYLFTDGYADQFGGPKNKKFRYKQLEEILLANTLLPMKLQKDILEKAFMDWKGKCEQVDDVLVIGIRI